MLAIALLLPWGGVARRAGWDQ
eukprot:COSAG02_NODE_37341_length_443_cov_0.750000_1_plen_21_part_10